jgi:HAE1 family hydrophobic/amphiphilic exporter-1
MVPLGTFVDVQDTIGPQIILRYNLYPTAIITGEAALGYSSGQALQLMEQMARSKLPPSMGYEWTGISYQEKKVGGEAYLIFALAVLLVIALASKNAILIVEFAREQRSRGLGVAEAAIEAARLRFRPILMTSFAFILGVYPLVIADGAGAASRRALGTAVFGGMITSTLLAVLFVPAFYVVFQSASERWALRRGRKRAAPASEMATNR